MLKLIDPWTETALFSPWEGREPTPLDGLGPTVRYCGWGGVREKCVLIHCLKVRASHSGSFLSNPPCNAINSPSQILGSVSDFGYRNGSNQTDSFQFRTGQNSHLHKLLCNQSPRLKLWDSAPKSRCSGEQWRQLPELCSHRPRQGLVQAADSLLRGQPFLSLSVREPRLMVHFIPMQILVLHGKRR